MSSLRLHSSRDRNSSGSGGITNEAFAQSSRSLYKRISSSENLARDSMEQSQSMMSTMPTTTPRMSSSVLTVPQIGLNAQGGGVGGGSTSPKSSRGLGDQSGQQQNASGSPASSNSSNTALHYQHQVHNHQNANLGELIAIKSKVWIFGLF